MKLLTGGLCAALISVLAAGQAQTLPQKPAQAAVQAPEPPFFDGLGGKPGIRKIVGLLLPIVLADPRIKETFIDSDMKNLAMRLEEQFCELSGGPCRYKGKDMATIHDGLNITNAQFNALAEDLQIAMEQAGVSARVQNRLIARLAPMQREIVTK